eukprot:gnl/MRDRNA2_/MRDRNA2_98264_c0_seq1.p1 gnl/MRDRNA2_/MRDRNA2_98264_c0~~gnl/MRDRNA2_/MRDRNA2_98264_c0_seq1.p1  ORF type:complete len:134 (+),score=23.09 gnl/MRDRNA2_/MRDRNA2_98264_c0_seq1:75-476(+)
MFAVKWLLASALFQVVAGKSRLLATDAYLSEAPLGGFHFAPIAKGKRCPTSNAKECEVKKKTPHGCFAAIWSCSTYTPRYFSVVMPSKNQTYKCYYEPHDLDPAKCEDGPGDVYEVRRGDPSVESDKMQSFRY